MYHSRVQGWHYVDIQWLNYIKTDSEGNKIYEASRLPRKLS